jgi:phage tail protein X
MVADITMPDVPACRHEVELMTRIWDV